jgi:hypothetical protein
MPVALGRLPRQGWLCILHDFEAKLLDHRVRKDLARDPFHLGLGGSAVKILDVEHEKFALADIAYRGMAE